MHAVCVFDPMLSFQEIRVGLKKETVDTVINFLRRGNLHDCSLVWAIHLGNVYLKLV